MDKNGKTHYYFADYIRFIACLGVIIYHFYVEIVHTVPLYIPRFISPALTFNNFSVPRVMVFLFLLLSGFFLFSPENKDFSVKEYYKSRFLKILIPFYIVFLLAVLYNGLFKDHILNIRNIKALDIPVFLLGADQLVAGITQTIGTETISLHVGEWFLGAIVIYYLIFPLLRKAVLRFPKSSLIVTVALFIGCLVLTLFPQGSAAWFLYFLEPFFIFVFGMFLSYYRESIKKVPVYVWALIFLISFLPIPHFEPLFHLLLVFSSIAIFELFFSLEKFFANRKWLTPRMAYLSSLTYPMFLLQHAVVLGLLECIAPRGTITTFRLFFYLGVTIILTILLAMVVKKFHHWLVRKY